MDKNKNQNKTFFHWKNYTNERSYFVRKLDNWLKQIRIGCLHRSDSREYGNKTVKPFAKWIEFTAAKNVVRQVFIFMEVSSSM